MRLTNNFMSKHIDDINDRYMSIKDDEVSFYVRLIGIYVAMSPGDAPFTEKQSIKVDSTTMLAYRALDEFERWIQTEATKTVRTIPNFDVAALFTDYRMKADNGITITGLANIGAACTLRGVSISKDFGQYATIETSAHEIGHNLGAYHDGTGNECLGSEQYLMASAPGQLTNKTYYNPFTFSPCSIRYFKNYTAQLDQQNNNCLKNTAYDANPQATAEFLKEIPGQKYSIDTQCRLLYGQNSFYCAGGGEKDKLICIELSCWRPDLGQCYSKVEQRALDGTPCGNAAWCLRGACTNDQRAPKGAASCMYGDYKATFNVDNQQIDCKTMVQTKPRLCYETHYNDLCCASCAAAKNTTFTGCEWGDQMSTCPTIPKDYCYDEYYRIKCCATCRKYELNLPIPNCRYGDKVDWCNGIKATSCYSASNDCCQTCLNYKTNTQGYPGCEYGDKNAACTREHCKSSIYWNDCCQTCQDVIQGKTSTSTTTTTTKSTSTTTTKPSSTSYPVGDAVSWCSSITAVDCYASKDTCRITCQKYYNSNNVGCEYGDKASWCSAYVKGASECQRSEVSTLCCQSCKPHASLSSEIPVCPNGDEAEFCMGIKPWDCYYYKSTCCNTCQKHYISGMKSCEYGDKVEWCASYVQGPQDCERPEVAELCCNTCSSRKMKESSSINKCTDSVGWCSGIFPGYCYDAQTVKTCCATCKKNLNGRTGDCRYGNFYDWCAPQFCSMNAVECCETCK